MEPQFLRAYHQRADDAGKPGDPMLFTASTAAIGRDGMVIDQAGWELDNYKANPVVLWCHNYGAWGDPEAARPIGKTERVWVEDDQLKAEIRFNQNYDFALGIEADYRTGFLNAVSVGWDTKEFQTAENPTVYGIAKRSELLDISCVPVPGDPNALKARQKRAAATLGREFLKLAGEPDTPADPANPPDPTPDSSVRATWPEDAAAMARLFQPFAQRPDAERETEHRRLARAYARHGKTPPEFLAQAELDALSEPDIRAHFLEGEPELAADAFAAMFSRAGAVLSQRNQDDLQRASDLILSVLTRAKKEADQSDEERAAADQIRALHAMFKKDE